MLSYLCDHTTNNVLSSTTARKLPSHISRFQFSHKFINIPLVHLIHWLSGSDTLKFKLKKVKNSDGEYSHV